MALEKKVDKKKVKRKVVCSGCGNGFVPWKHNKGTTFDPIMDCMVGVAQCPHCEKRINYI